MLYDSQLYTSVAGKSQACANYVLVSIRQHHFDGKWNTDLKIQNEMGSLCVRSPFGKRSPPLSVVNNIDLFFCVTSSTGVFRIYPQDLKTEKITSDRDLTNASGSF